LPKETVAFVNNLKPPVNVGKDTMDFAERSLSKALQTEYLRRFLLNYSRHLAETGINRHAWIDDGQAAPDFGARGTRDAKFREP
jgi:hypothetical protein